MFNKSLPKIFSFRLASIAFVLFALLLSTIQTTAVAADERPNVLLICVDDLRPELKSLALTISIRPTLTHWLHPDGRSRGTMCMRQHAARHVRPC